MPLAPCPTPGSNQRSVFYLKKSLYNQVQLFPDLLQQILCCRSLLNGCPFPSATLPKHIWNCTDLLMFTSRRKTHISKQCCPPSPRLCNLSNPTGSSSPLECGYVNVSLNINANLFCVREIFSHNNVRSTLGNTLCVCVRLTARSATCWQNMGESKSERWKWRNGNCISLFLCNLCTWTHC